MCARDGEKQAPSNQGRLHPTRPSGTQIFERLAGAPAPATTAELAEQLSWLVGELNQLHPFREGAGRTMRTYATNWAQQHGHDIGLDAWPRDQWRTASIGAFHNDHQPLTHLVVSDLERLPLDDLRTTLGDWANTYDQLTRIDHLDNGVTLIENSTLLAGAVDHSMNTIRDELQNRFGSIVDTLQHDTNTRGLGQQHITGSDAHTIGNNVGELDRIAVVGAIAQFRDAWNVESRNTQPDPDDPLQLRHFDHVKQTISDAMRNNLATTQQRQPPDPGPRISQ